MKLLFIFPELVSYLGNLQRKGQKKTTNGVSQSNHSPVPKSRETIDSWDVVAVNIMEKRIMISDVQHSLTWNSSSKYVIRFPLNGCCKVNAMQVTTLFRNEFELITSGVAELRDSNSQSICSANPTCPRS